MFDGNDRLAKMIGKMLLALLVSLFLLCAGIGLVVLVYLWLVWYASLHGFTQQRGNALDKAPKQGLSEADIQKLPTIESSASAADAECAVCLDSFQGGERCRLIPACNHRFHVQCADPWLSKRSVCPICRTGVFEAQREGEVENGTPLQESGVLNGGISTAPVANLCSSSDTTVDIPAIAVRPEGDGAGSEYVR